MKISQEILVGLKRVGNPSLVKDENLDKLLNEISDLLDNPLNSNYKVDIPSDTPKIDIVKECYACLLTFLVEGIRWKENPSILKKILRDNKFPDERIDKILSVYTSKKLPVELCLKQLNSDPPHIFDVNWKMNYCVKSSFSDFDNKILFFIDFTVGKKHSKDSNELVQKNSTEKISFVCTVNQLQSLVASLKAAVRHLETIAEGAK